MKTPSDNDVNVKELCKKIKDVLYHVFINNWSLKLTAILLSTVLWAGLISQDPTLTRDRTFSNVPVTINGKESLLRNGYIVVSDLSEKLQNCQISVAVPQQQYETTEASNYNVRVDLSRINTSGPQEIRLVYSNSGTYGKITGITPETISVDVEEYITRTRIPVSVSMTGDIPQGWYITSPTADPSLIAISGPKSMVESVSRARVLIDPSQIIWEQGTSRIAAPITLYDKNGEPLDDPLIEKTFESILIQSVIVEQNIYPQKTVMVSELGAVQGNPAQGYNVTAMTASPDRVTIAAPQAVLDTIEKLYPESIIDVSGASQNVSGRFTISRPAEIVYMSSDTINQEIEISPVNEEKIYNGIPIETINVPAGVEVKLNKSRTTVTIKGEKLKLKSIKNSDIRITLDVKNFTEPGEYKAVMNCAITGMNDDEYDWSIDANGVRVRVENK